MEDRLESCRKTLRGRPHLIAVGAFALGLALSPAPNAATAAAALAAAALAALRTGPLPLIAAVLLAAGALIGDMRLEPLEQAERTVREGERVNTTATLLERPRPGRFGSTAAMELHSERKVLARLGDGTRLPDAGRPGTIVHIRGTLGRPRSKPDAAFDWRAHLRRRGIVAELDVHSVEATGRRRGGLAGLIDGMRDRAERAMNRGLDRDQAALLRGMVLGQDEQIADTVRDDFRTAGLGHLLAVSGQNVMLLGALALPLLGAARLSPGARIAVLLVLIAIYVPLAGAGPSLQRAAVMGAAGLAAMALGRTSSRWYCLLLAAAVTLLVNPLAAGDPGWQLSFAAVAGILVLAPPLSAAMRPLPRLLRDGIALTLAATIATTPLAAHHFGSIPAAGLAANVAALPAVAPVMWIGMAQSALGQLGIGEADRLLGQAARFPLAWLAAVAERFAELPGAQLRLPLHTPLHVAAAYALLIAALLLARRAAAELDRDALAGELRAAPATIAVRQRWHATPIAARVALAAALLAAGGAGAHAALAPPAPPKALTVSFLDVGQGDATLIQHPDGSAVLFDAGPPEARTARLLRRAGVRRLSAVVATHASRDHHGGLVEVLERFPVDLLVDGGDGSADPGFRAALASAQKRGVRRTSALAGQTLRAGALEIRILSPSPRPPGPAPEDPNLRAVVAIVSSGGFDLLLSADAESPSLLPLALPDVDAMKVPHHGSADPGLPEVLARVRPELAVIEVGEGNSYGHPAPPTLAELGQVVPHVHRTDRDGTVSVTVRDGSMRIHSER